MLHEEEIPALALWLLSVSYVQKKDNGTVKQKITMQLQYPEKLSSFSITYLSESSANFNFGQYRVFNVPNK